MTATRGWVRRPEIVDYVVECYAGAEAKPEGKGRPHGRRVFLWEEDGHVYMGNVEAFLLHLKARFDLVLCATATTAIHALLRELGETLWVPLSARQSPTPGAGSFVQPDPERWEVGS